MQEILGHLWKICLSALVAGNWVRAGRRVLFLGCVLVTLLAGVSHLQNETGLCDWVGLVGFILGDGGGLAA